MPATATEPLMSPNQRAITAMTSRPASLTCPNVIVFSGQPSGAAELLEAAFTDQLLISGMCQSIFPE